MYQISLHMKPRLSSWTLQSTRMCLELQYAIATSLKIWVSIKKVSHFKVWLYFSVNLFIIHSQKASTVEAAKTAKDPIWVELCPQCDLPRLQTKGLHTTSLQDWLEGWIQWGLRFLRCANTTETKEKRNWIPDQQTNPSQSSLKHNWNWRGN